MNCYPGTGDRSRRPRAKPLDNRRGVDRMDTFSAGVTGVIDMELLSVIRRWALRDCVFRRKAAGDSDSFQPVIPTEASQ
jgi:hypothetical protein